MSDCCSVVAGRSGCLTAAVLWRGVRGEEEDLDGWTGQMSHPKNVFFFWV